VEETQYKGFILTDHKLLALTNNALQKKSSAYLPAVIIFRDNFCGQFGHF